MGVIAPEWKPYSVSFESPEGQFSFHIYAISFEHAQLQIDAIRETAKLDGELISDSRNSSFLD